MSYCFPWLTLFNICQLRIILPPALMTTARRRRLAFPPFSRTSRLQLPRSKQSGCTPRTPSSHLRGNPATPEIGARPDVPLHQPSPSLYHRRRLLAERCSDPFPAPGPARRHDFNKWPCHICSTTACNLLTFSRGKSIFQPIISFTLPRKNMASTRTRLFSLVPPATKGRQDHQPGDSPMTTAHTPLMITYYRPESCLSLYQAPAGGPAQYHLRRRKGSLRRSRSGRRWLQPRAAVRPNRGLLDLAYPARIPVE